MEAASDIILMESESTEATMHAKHRGADIGQDDLNEMMHETFAASSDKSKEAIDVPSEEEVRNPEAESGEKQKTDEGSAPANDENNMTIVEQMEQAKQ